MRDIKFRVYSTVTGSFYYVSILDLMTSDNSRISKKMAHDDLSDALVYLADYEGWK